MEEIIFKKTRNSRAGFFMMDGEEQLAEMEVGIEGNIMTVYHTEVAAQAEGKGFGKKLLAAMVEHARSNGLKVVALCPFVHGQFKRYPEQYADIINKTPVS